MTIPKFRSAQLLHIYCVIFFEGCEFFVCPISKIGKNDLDIEYNMWQAHFIQGTDSLKIGEYETICGTLYILAISYSQNYQSCNFQSVKFLYRDFLAILSGLPCVGASPKAKNDFVAEE